LLLAARVVADTSALVSLALAGLLEKSAETAEILIPPEVLAELRQVASFKDEEGAAAKAVLQLVSADKILVRRVKGRERLRRSIYRTDLGEAACLQLCVENGVSLLVCDDIDASYRLEAPALAKGIRLRISAAFVAELARTGKLSKKQAMAAIRRMNKLRHWEGGALETLAEKYLNAV